jgi:hypothetical protein
MADNFEVTEGSGTTFASEDVAGVHYQKLKLIDGTGSSTTAIAAGEGAGAGGVRVAWANDQASPVGVASLVAHDAVDSGNPIKLGAKAITAAPTPVAADDRTDLFADRYGQQYVNTKHVNHWKVYHDIAAADGAHTDEELVAAPGAGLSLYVTDIYITNDATAALVVTLSEDEGGASEAPIMGKVYVPASGERHVTWAQPLKLTANLSLGFTNAGQSNASITISGYTAP